MKNKLQDIEKKINKQSTPRHADISPLLRGGYRHAKAFKTVLSFVDEILPKFLSKDKTKTLSFEDLNYGLI